MNDPAILRPHAEHAYAEELAALRDLDDRPCPVNWQMSPWAVLTYLMGGKLSNGFEVKPKYYGDRRLIEIALATLVTDRALLLVGIPGTAKTWVAEHLAAGISGDSTLLIQGTSALGEEAIRYGWNYAKLLAEGPTKDALVPSPLMHAMQTGKMVRIEELTRIPSEIQDTLITILSEKVLPIPELNTELLAIRGFNVIATANDRDKGVHELSSALQRRFNVVNMPLPASIEEEMEIVQLRVQQNAQQLQLPEIETPKAEIERVITIFRELRNGKTEDGQSKVKRPSGTLSPAEAISVINSGQALAAHFGDGKLRPKDIVAGILGAVMKDPAQDQQIWQEYLETIVKERKEWADFYKACRTIFKKR